MLKDKQQDIYFEDHLVGNIFYLPLEDLWGGEILESSSFQGAFVYGKTKEIATERLLKRVR